MKAPGLEHASYNSSPHPIGQTQLPLSKMLSHFLRFVWWMEKGRGGLAACIGYHCFLYKKEKWAHWAERVRIIHHQSCLLTTTHWFNASLHVLLPSFLLLLILTCSSSTSNYLPTLHEAPQVMGHWCLLQTVMINPIDLGGEGRHRVGEVPVNTCNSLLISASEWWLLKVLR